MTVDRCPLCNERRKFEGHHPTGRRASKPIHPGLLFEICFVCNNAMNLLWQRQGVDASGPSAKDLKRRLAMWIDLLAGRPTSAEHAHELALAVADLPILERAA